jgi:hypothetical protein
MCAKQAHVHRTTGVSFTILFFFASALLFHLAFAALSFSPFFQIHRPFIAQQMLLHLPFHTRKEKVLVGWEQGQGEGDHYHNDIHDFPFLSCTNSHLHFTIFFLSRILLFFLSHIYYRH